MFPRLAYEWRLAFLRVPNLWITVWINMVVGLFQKIRRVRMPLREWDGLCSVMDSGFVWMAKSRALCMDIIPLNKGVSQNKNVK